MKSAALTEQNKRHPTSSPYSSLQDKPRPEHINLDHVGYTAILLNASNVRSPYPMPSGNHHIYTNSNVSFIDRSHSPVPVACPPLPKSGVNDKPSPEFDPGGTGSGSLSHQLPRIVGLPRMTLNPDGHNTGKRSTREECANCQSDANLCFIA